MKMLVNVCVSVASLRVAVHYEELNEAALRSKLNYNYFGSGKQRETSIYILVNFLYYNGSRIRIILNLAITCIKPLPLYTFLAASCEKRHLGIFRSGYHGCVLRGVEFIKLLYLFHVFGQTGLSKQCRPRSDAAERGV